MNFEVAVELRDFGESVRSAIDSWEPPLGPDLGVWNDDRDDELAERLAGVGWLGFWEAGLPPLVAGAIELGKAVAPLCLVDEVTLGAPLAVGVRVRHGATAPLCAVPLAGWGFAFGAIADDRRHEQTLDGSGTVVARYIETIPFNAQDADDRWAAWTAATLGYLAGLADAAHRAAVAHSRRREQFGRPLGKLPAVQARLADAALLVDGLTLTAWQSAAPANVHRESALLWAGSACREVTAAAHQIHGALGFALESGLHRYYRRAKSAQVWAAEVCRICE